MLGTREGAASLGADLRVDTRTFDIMCVLLEVNGCAELFVPVSFASTYVSGAVLALYRKHAIAPTLCWK